MNNESVFCGYLGCSIVAPSVSKQSVNKFGNFICHSLHESVIVCYVNFVVTLKHFGILC